MKSQIIIYTILLIFSLNKLHSQDCYSDETIKYSHKNFSDLWFIDYSYNGTIGNDNKRIEMHITKTEKINDTKYRVIGKYSLSKLLKN